MMSQTVCWASAPQRWMAGLSSQNLHSLVRDEHVQIDIYDTRDNCWRIGLLKGLWKPKGGSKKLCLLTWWIILVLKDANKISKEAGKSFSGGSNRECKDTEERQIMKLYVRNLCMSVCLGHGLYDGESCQIVKVLLYEMKNMDFMQYLQRVKENF